MSNRSGYSGFTFKPSNSKLNNSSKKYSMNAVPPPSSLNALGRVNQQVSLFYVEQRRKLYYFMIILLMNRQLHSNAQHRRLAINRRQRLAAVYQSMAIPPWIQSRNLPAHRNMHWVNGNLKLKTSKNMRLKHVVSSALLLLLSVCNVMYSHTGILMTTKKLHQT